MIARALTDLLLLLAATIAFLPLVFAPGHLVAHWANLFAYRTQPAHWKLTLALPLSIAILPLPLFALWSIHVNCVIALYYLLAAATLIALWQMRRELLTSRFLRPVLLIGGLWFLIVAFALIDLPFHGGLYLTSLAYQDHSFRVELVAAIAQSHRLPPPFPFLAGDDRGILRYYYYWFMVSAVPTAASAWRIGARAAHNAGLLWIGLALFSTIALFWRFFFAATNIWRRFKLSFFAISLMGFQALVELALNLRDYHLYHLWIPNNRTLNATLDPKGNFTYSLWLDSLLWVPHHAAALISCLIGSLALYQLFTSTTRRERLILITLAALAFASAIGMSVFVVLPFFAFLGLYSLIELLRHPAAKRWLAPALTLVLAGLFTAPYMLSVRSPQGTPFPLRLEVRPTYLPIYLLSHHGSSAFAHTQLAALFSIPFLYIYSFGILAIVSFWALRQLCKSCDPLQARRNKLIASFVTISALLSLFISSTPISGVGSNDFGWRAPMGATFLLIFFSVFFFEDFRARKFATGRITRVAIWALISIGLFSTAYEYFNLRTFKPLTQSQQIGQLQADFREATDYLHAHATDDNLTGLAAPSQIVQLNPEKDDPVPAGLFLERSTAFRQGDNVFYHYNTVSAAELARIHSSVAALFTSNTLTTTQAINQARALNINYLILQVGDPAFDAPSGWAANATAWFQNRTTKIIKISYPCFPQHPAADTLPKSSATIQ